MNTTFLRLSGTQGFQVVVVACSWGRCRLRQECHVTDEGLLRKGSMKATESHTVSRNCSPWLHYENTLELGSVGMGQVLASLGFQLVLKSTGVYTAAWVLQS